MQKKDCPHIVFRVFTTMMFLSSLGAMLGCDDDGNSDVEIVVDTYNVGLAGAFIPYEEDRRQPLAETLAAMDSDVICLQEVWRQSDKEAIISATADAYPYVVSFEHDLSTVIDDPTDQQGVTPEPFTTAPCADADLQTALNQVVDCLRENCSTIPDSDEGQTTGIDCAAEYCTGAVAALLFGDDRALRCYGCAAPSLPTATFAEIRTSCTTDINAGLAFGGQSGVMILSRHPVSDSRAYVFPGTWNRRVVAITTVSLPNGADLDVYCNHLTPIFDGMTYPYTGQYGEGETGAAGWAAEQLLQAEKLIDLVQTNSGEGRALILGDFNAGPAHQDADGNTVVVSEGLATFEALEGAFTPAVAADYEPLCTYCPENPISSDADEPVWIDHIFAYNLATESVVATERILLENVVEVAGDPNHVPLSDHYGLRSTIAIAP